jgi:hypothetical protein
VDLTQPTSIRNQGAFFPEIHENVFDRLTMIDQQQQEQLDRSLHIPSGSSVSTVLPPPSANSSLAWDATGSSLINVPALTPSAEALQFNLAATGTGQGADLVGYKAPFTGAVPRTQQNKNAECVSVFDFMTSAQITAIKTRSTTQDKIANSASLQAAINAACANGFRLHLPAGDYRLGVCVDLTSTVGWGGGNGSGTDDRNHFEMVGDCLNSTRLIFLGVSTMFETQGSDAITLKDFYAYGFSGNATWVTGHAYSVGDRVDVSDGTIASGGNFVCAVGHTSTSFLSDLAKWTPVADGPSVGIYAGRGNAVKWGGNHYYERVAIYLEHDSTMTKNGGCGSIALINAESEESKYHGLELSADLPFMCAVPNNMSCLSFDSTCNYTGSRTFTYTPVYAAILTSAMSNTVFHFSGGCRIISHTFDSPVVALRTVAAIDFGNTFFQHNQANGITAYKNPFTFDMAAVWGFESHGNHETTALHGTLGATLGAGVACISGDIYNANLTCTGGFKDGYNGNNVPIFYIWSNPGSMQNCRFAVRSGSDLDQLQFKTYSGSGWQYSIHDTEFKFTGNGTTANIPKEMLLLASKTRITSGSHVGTGDGYSSVYCDSLYRRLYSIAKPLTLNTATKVFKLELPPSDISVGTANFKGTLLCNSLSQETCVKAGELCIQWTRRMDTGGLNPTTAYSRWSPAQSTNSGTLTMSDPVISFSSDVSQQDFNVLVLAGTSGSGAAGAGGPFMIGELEVITQYGSSGQTARVTVF